MRFSADPSVVDRALRGTPNRAGRSAAPPDAPTGDRRSRAGKPRPVPLPDPGDGIRIPVPGLRVPATAPGRNETRADADSKAAGRDRPPPWLSSPKADTDSYRHPPGNPSEALSIRGIFRRSSRLSPTVRNLAHHPHRGGNAAVDDRWRHRRGGDRRAGRRTVRIHRAADKEFQLLADVLTDRNQGAAALGAGA